MTKTISILVIGYFLLLLRSISPFEVIAAEQQLYLLSGCPTPKSDVEFPSDLYKVNELKKKLDMVREVVSKDKGTELIRTYYDKRIVVIETKLGKVNDGNLMHEFSMIDMNTPLSEKDFKMSYPQTFSEIEAHLFDIPNNGLYQGIYLSRNQATEIMLLGINLSTMKQEELSWDVYKYILLSGIPGGATPGEVFVVNSKVDGQIMFPTVKGKIETNWKLPPNIKVKDNERIAIFVNNNDVLALILSESRVKNKTGLGYTPFHILDKKNNKWHTMQFQGGRTGVRGFGPWLAGYVADEERSVPGIKKGERRREDMRKSGTPSAWRFEDFKIYSPGILFIYNVLSNKKYSIETGQMDSEVLLVEDNNVYYRVNDEIYQAKIGEKKIETGTLIVKDEAVHDIHWAFIGPLQG